MTSHQREISTGGLQRGGMDQISRRIQQLVFKHTNQLQLDGVISSFFLAKGQESETLTSERRRISYKLISFSASPIFSAVWCSELLVTSCTYDYEVS